MRADGIISLTHAACTIFSNVTYLVSYSPTQTVEEGDMATLFFLGLWIGASGENVSPPTAGHQQTKTGQALP